MTRVGFVLPYTHNGWLGGINYLTNLLHAIGQITPRTIEPVLLVGPDTPGEVLASLPRWPVLQTMLADGSHRVVRLVRKVPERVLGSDLAMTRFLRQHQIELLSHSGQLGARARLPTIGWLPDFQHQRMPEFFRKPEIATIERAFRRIAEQCSTVVLSSEDAQRDLATLAPAALPNSRVLRFVAGFAAGAVTATDEATLRLRYGIEGPYFHLPNQFWVHKNHGVVIEALAALRARGRRVRILCTGATRDWRQPGHYDSLIARATQFGVNDCFRVLGIVPYADLAGLMRHAVAVVNPSLFEGWSTTVEEGKSLGLTIVLSDIPVHREQAPEYGVFFNPRDPESLADVLSEVQDNASLASAQLRQRAAQDRLPHRFRAFGEAYQAIVQDTLARN